MNEKLALVELVGSGGVEVKATVGAVTSRDAAITVQLA